MGAVLITGAGGGLGKALAVLFAIEGRDLVLHWRNSEPPRISGPRCAIVRGDLRDEETLGKLARTGASMKVDTLVNNAGIHGSWPFEDTSLDDIEDIVAVNLVAPVKLTRMVWPTLKANGGLVVNINSLAGRDGGDGEAAYSASKGGLRGFSKALRFDAIRDRVRVLDVYLGAMKTDMSRYRKDWDRMIEPSDAARVIVGLTTRRPSTIVSEVVIHRRLR
jgi:short-subunit dehydrogenase